MSADEKHKPKNCNRCGKIFRSEYRGTMTAWIFGGNPCSCSEGGGPAYSRTDFRQADLSQDRHETPVQFQSQIQPKIQLQAGSQSQANSQVQANIQIRPLSHKPDLGSRFEVLDLLGEGGMGSVYKIREIDTGKIFAAKILKDFLANDPNATRRFEQEVRAASELTHPNLVFIYGSYRCPDGTPYMVMNFVDGISLGELLKFEHYFEYKRALQMFTQVVDALIHAHSKGIVHRDLKPNNILIYQHEQRRDAVRVVDFGIAKIIDPNSTSTDGFTKTGEIFGSPLYMSPEQCSGEKLDARSDIYTLGCVMYHSLYGQPPFNDSNPMKTMLSHINSPPVLTQACKSKNVPKDVERVVMRCLAKSPSARYQSAEALANDLNAILAGRRISGGGLKTNLNASTWKIIAIIVVSLIIGAAIATGITLYLTRGAEHIAPSISATTPAPKAKNNYEPGEVVSTALSSEIKREFSASVARDQNVLDSATPIESKTMILNGQETRKFVFPSISIGDLCRYSDLDVTHVLVREARGIVGVPPHIPLTLAVHNFIPTHALTAVLATPSIFAKIKPTEFYGLSLRTDDTSVFNDQTNDSSKAKSKNLADILKSASGWTNLKMVSLRNFHNIDQALPMVNEMKHLRFFQLYNCSLKSAESADQPFWSQLQGVRIGFLDKAVTANILKRLEESQNLENLTVIDLQLSASQLERLRNCRKLATLEVKQKVVTEDLLAAVAELKSLRKLTFLGCTLSEKQIRKLLSQNPKLTELDLPISRLSVEDNWKLRSIDARVLLKAETTLDEAINKIAPDSPN